MPSPSSAPPAFGEPVAVPASSGPVLELLEVHAAAAEPRLGGPLMKALAAAAPLTGLQHVKRVRKAGSQLHILLCRADWRQQQEQQQGQTGQAQQGSQAREASPAGSGSQQQQGGATPDLPPAVAEIVKQHGLQTFTAQVCGEFDASQACQLPGSSPRAAAWRWLSQPARRSRGCPHFLLSHHPPTTHCAPPIPPCRCRCMPH